MPSLRDIYKKPDALSDVITTKGDLLVRDTAPTRLPVGSDNQVLVADSSEATGLKWAFVDTGFAVVNTSFTTPLVGETVIITVSNNKWMYAGMYVYIQDAGVYYVVSKSGTTLVTVRNEYDISQGNSAPSTTIGIARGIVPAGRRGSDGNNSYSTVTSSFTIPAALDTSTLSLGATSWISEGQILYIFDAGYFEVITKINATTLTVKNLGYDGNLVTGTVDTGTLVTTSGIKGLDGVNAYTYTSVQFTQPIAGQNVVITVEDSRWMSVGQHIYIEGGGAYVVIDVISLISIEIQNLGSPENVSSGTLVATAAKVSPSGLTGVAGSNALATTLDVAGFTQPAVNGTVQITVGTTEFLAAGSYVYIPSGGFYKVISIDSISQLTIENIGDSDNAPESSSITGNVLIVPSAKPGIDGVDGIDGSNGLDGQDGQGIDHISLTSTTGPIDTYTIWGDLAETINLGTFEVVDGIDGINGVDGTDGVDGQGIDHISLTNTTGSVDTYTVWGDVEETINLGTFTITNGSVSAASSLSLDHQVTDPAQIVDKLILYSKADGLYYRQPDGSISKVITQTDVGTNIGDIIELVDVGGQAALPAVDGSQLLNLPAGGHTIQEEGVNLPQQSNLNFTGDLVNATDNVASTDITISSGLSNLGDILYHDGTGLNTLPKGTAGQVLTSDDTTGLTWTDAGTAGGTFNSPTTTKGDLIVRGDTEDTRLAVGAENTFLSPDPSSPTGLTWKNPVLGGAMLFDNAIESVQVTTPSLVNNESAIVYADISRTYLLTKVEEIYGKQVDVEVLSNDLSQDVPDPNVVLMLNANGNNGDTSTIDSSLSNHTITFNGNAQISTTQSKFGGSSFYFDGSGDFLTIPISDDFIFGTGDFTIEFWFYALTLNFVTNSRTLLDMRPDSTNGQYLSLFIHTNSTLRFSINSSNTNTTGVVTTDQFYHFAISRSSGNIKVFQNGSEVYSGTHTNNLQTGIIKIAANAFRSTAGDTYFNGYIDDIRITKGVARYTSNFTPPTSELTALTTEQGKSIASYTNFTTQETSLLGYIDQPSLGNKVPLRVTNRSGATTTLTLNLDVIKTSTTNLNLAKGLDNPPKYYTIVTGTLAAGASEVVSVDFPRVYILSDLQASVDSQLSVFSRYKNGVVDPYWNNVVLYLQGDGANNSTNIIDSSLAPKTLTRLGDTKISTTQSKYGGSSIYFDGNGDYILSGLNQSNFYLESELNWTIDFWIYFSTDPTTRQTILSNRTSTTGYVIGTVAGTGHLAFSAIGRSNLVSDAPLLNNQWYHIAITRSSSNIDLFINGIKQSSSYTGTISASASEHRIGGYDQVSLPYYFNGYIDSFRITKDVARYTTNFNPETDTYLAPADANLLQTYNLTANQTLETNLLGFNEDPADSQVKLQITNTSGVEQAITVEAELVEMQPATPNYKFDNAPTEVTVTTGTLAAGASEIVSLPYPRVCVLSDLTADVDCNVEFYSRYNESVGEGTDPYLDNVVLYLKGDGENNSTNIIDSSPVPKTVTVNGGAIISTSQSKYGQSSLYIPGGAGPWVVSSNAEFNLGTIYTIEMWCYLTDVSAVRGLFFIGNSALDTNRNQLGTVSGGSTLRWFQRTSSTDILSLDTTVSVPLNQWSHIAAVRSNNDVHLFINGIKVSTTMSGDPIPLNNIHVGMFRAGGSTHSTNGHIDSFRITKGVARYTSNFNPETDTYLAPLNSSSLQTYTLTANTLQETNLLTFNEDPSDSYLKAKITNTSASPAAITLTTEIIPVFSPTGMTWRLATTSQQAQPEVGYFFDTDQPVTLTLPTSPAIGTTVYCGLLQVTNLTVTGGVINGGGNVSITTVGQLHRFIYTNPTYGWFYEVLNSTGGGALTIKDEGIDLVQRSALNFTGELVTVSDNSGADSTDVAINLPNTINLGTWTP